MKILQVVSTPPFAWSSGGCARAVYEISKALARKGHEVTILTTDIHGPGDCFPSLRIDEVVDGVRIVRAKHISDWLAWKHKLYLSPGATIFLRKHVRGFDVVHLQDLLSILAISTERYCVRLKVPYVLTTHGSIGWLLDPKLMNRLYLRVFGTRIIKSASRVLALSNSEAGQYKLIGIPNRITEIVPNAIDAEEFKNLPSKGEFRDMYKIPMNEPVILSLGRLHRIKGLDMLLEAFSESIKDTSANSKLVIVGPDDGFLHTLEKMVLDLGIENRVIITGPLYDRAKLGAFVDASVFVLSSIYETFPNTVLESWACGTPVIATDRCGIANLMEGAGLVVRHSADDLGKGIRKMLSDEELRTKLSSEGKSRVMNEFVWSRVVSNVERIYEEVIAEQKLRSSFYVS